MQYCNQQRVVCQEEIGILFIFSMYTRPLPPVPTVRRVAYTKKERSPEVGALLFDFDGSSIERIESMSQQQHRHKQEGDDPGADLDLLEIPAEGTDHHIGDQSEGDSIGNIIGKGHHGKSKKRGNGNLEVRPVDLFHRTHHQNPDIDQSGGGGTPGHQLGNGAQKHGDKEEESAKDRGQPRSTARGHARVYLTEGRHG